MSLAKSVVTGTVYRTPEKRFTQNNVGVSAFVLNIGDRDEMLVRVISKRNTLDDLVSSLKKATKFLLKAVFKQQQQKWTTEQKKEFTKLMPTQSKDGVKLLRHQGR